MGELSPPDMSTCEPSTPSGHSSHAHKAGSSPLGVLFKTSNEHSSPFNMVVSPGQVDMSILKKDHVRLLVNVKQSRINITVSKYYC